MRKYWILGIVLVALLSIGFYPSGGADQVDFPLIYIDDDAGDGGVGSQADPYNELSDINWTTGGDNSIFDYLAGSPSESPTIYLQDDDEWRETLTVGCSGTATYPIVISSYGSGADPIITATDLMATWITTLNDWDLAPSFTVNPSGDYNIRCLIPASSVGANGAQVRVKLGTGANESVLDEIFIGEQASAGDAFDMEGGTVSELLFSAGSGATISASSSEWSDWLTYAFDDSKAYFISIGGTANWGRMGAGQQLYYDADGAAAAGTANVAGYSSVDFVWTFMAIEVRTVADAGVNTWQVANTTEPNIVLFDSTVGTGVANMAAVDGANEWWWDTNVLYVYSASDPDSAYTSPGVEAGARDTSITANKDYITLNGLHLYGANHATLGGFLSSKAAGGGDYLTLVSCTVEKNINHGIYCVNTNNVTLTNCVVQNNLDHGVLFVESSDSYDVNNITITGGTYQNNVTNGIYLFGTNASTQKITSGGMITGITATGNGAAIYFTKADGVTVTGCTLHTNTNTNGSGEGYGIGCQSGSSHIIYANTIYDNRTRAIEFWGESGAQSDSNKFYRNNVYGHGDYGIHFSTAFSDNNEVYYNLVHSNTTTGIYMGHNAANSGNLIYNNVLYANGTYDMDFDAGADGYTVSNNIFYTTGTYGLSVTATTTVTHSNNCYYKASGNVITYNGTPYTMATATNFEATCVNEDPLMTDPASDDFTLNPHSPCIDKGTDVSLTEDYLGLKLRHAPDIGAYENQTNALFLPHTWSLLWP